MVKALKLQTTPSGTYTNASEGIMPPYLVNVQFGCTDSTSIKVGTAGTGISSSDFWNLITLTVDGDGESPGVVAELSCLDSTGNSSGVTTEVFYGSSGNIVGVSGQTADDPLFQNFITTGGGSPFEFSLSLPTGTYDIYLYGAGFVDTWASPNYRLYSTFNIVSGANNSGSFGSESTSSSPSYNINTLTSGNQYVVFAGVQVTGGTPLVFQADQATLLEEPPLNGIQVVLQHN